MRGIIDRLFTFHVRRNDPSFRDCLERWMIASNTWDSPVLYTAFLNAVAELGSAGKT